MRFDSGSGGGLLATGEQDVPHPFMKRLRPYHALLGIAVQSMQEGRSTASLSISEEIKNSGGVIHGGAVASLCDVVLATAAMSSEPDITAVATASMSITYLAPASSDLQATGIALGGGRNIVGAECEVRRSDGMLIAKAIASLRLVRGASANSELER